MFSIIVPLYRSEENLPRLFRELTRIAAECPEPVELVLVNDGSPDRSAEIAERALPELPMQVQLIRLTRNFGAFAAIAAGLEQARGDYLGVIAADLQEPPEILLRFREEMVAGAEVVFGVRTKRHDPLVTRLSSNLFWALYRTMVNPEIPPGGVDVFGCSRRVRDRICAMKEVETSLVGLLFWIGHRRAFVPYERRARLEGKSAWTFSKKMTYLINSIFNFTDLPIRILLTVGVLGMLLAVAGAAVVVAARIGGQIPVPGYAAIIVTAFFFGGLSTAGLGIVGQYLWLCLQNARSRPAYLIESQRLKEAAQERPAATMRP
jgi:glycosyltransferase involved in cell wall biosynthesis